MELNISISKKAEKVTLIFTLTNNRKGISYVSGEFFTNCLCSLQKLVVLETCKIYLALVCGLPLSFPFSILKKVNAPIEGFNHIPLKSVCKPHNYTFPGSPEISVMREKGQNVS